ncbi:hypothetical protein NUM3379_04910 [Kineococcus sp. NUM-3379]
MSAANPRPASRREEGSSLLMVVGVFGIVAMLLPVLFLVVVQDVRDAGAHLQRDSGERAARSGIQAVMAALEEDGDHVPAGTALYFAGVTPVLASATALVPAGATTPPGGALVATPDQAPTGTAGHWSRLHGWDSKAWEHRFARAALMAVPNAYTQTTPVGRYRVIRPPVGVDAAGVLQFGTTVYALGWPLDAGPDSGKIVVAEYASVPYDPAAALLTDHDLEFSGSFVTSRAPGTTAPADVHTNGHQSGTASSVSIAGSVTASGSSTFGAAASHQPRRAIASVDPRFLYETYSPTWAKQWYDLCPDGKVHRPATTGVPCANPATVTAATAPGMDNWRYAGGTWTQSEPGAPSGIYYVYRGDAVLWTKSSVRQTVITESTRNLACPKTGDGNLEVKRMTLTALLPGVALVSGADLVLHSQAEAVDGVVAAQERIDMNTSSSPGIVGYAVAQNRCSADNVTGGYVAPNTFQGNEIIYKRFPTLLRSTRPRVTAETVLRAG